MKKQIIRISPVQTAKVFAGFYFVITIPFLLFSSVIFIVIPGGSRPPFFSALMLGLPFIYAVAGFIFTIIGAWVYNFIAKYLGGIEYTSEEIE
jgi:hypothetical protein